MRIGIFFGGLSREREISFAGGRTVYDNLDKGIFEPVPVFVDSFGNFIKLNWPCIYKGSIRDFYPQQSAIPFSPNHFQIYAEQIGNLNATEQQKLFSEIGISISIDELKSEIDFAFLALHGAFGEDGTIQGMLEFAGIPYSGSGILPSAIGMNKARQKQLMKDAGWNLKPSFTIERDEWLKANEKKEWFSKAKQITGLPFVVRPANQGSSIGVSIISMDDEQQFSKAVDQAFFIYKLSFKEWVNLDEQQQISLVRKISEIKDGTGLPFNINQQTIYHPEQLLKFIKESFSVSDTTLNFESFDKENEVLIEGFISGKEFSCIVIQDENGKAIALPPTEIVKDKEVFDYRSKYLAGLSRKITPIKIADELIEKIRSECQRLFDFFGFHVYARIDGFVEADGSILLNDPNTTSGMLPSSFFFHQAAEIGLNPSQFLTYIIYTSLIQRMKSWPRQNHCLALLDQLNKKLQAKQNADHQKIKVAVILGGYSSERHISVESGRNIFEKLSSSNKYQPVPVFLSGNAEHYKLIQIPINLLLKDNADDIKDKSEHFQLHPVIEKIKMECNAITKKFSDSNYSFAPIELNIESLKQQVDEVFIALHGRPGEDGALQKELEKIGLPYNGSGVASSQITINKFATNQLLKRNGFIISDQLLVYKKDFEANEKSFLQTILSQFQFPFIVKPVDDGCSSAVKKIKSLQELEAFARLIFRNTNGLNETDAATLHLKPKEEFPAKQEFLVEKLIDANGADKFLEVTVGMLTHLQQDGTISYEVFEPSETLATDDVLSLEEKFLAGEGQNITPARLATTFIDYSKVAHKVKSDLQQAAKLLGIVGYCRIDAFVRIYKNGKVETIIIEVNSLPGMTPATCIYHQAAINGYKPFNFIDEILEFSIVKNKIGIH